MSDDRWERVADLYQAAQERAPEERLAFVRQTSGGDSDLRREVELLLAQDEKTVVIDRPIAAAAHSLLADNADVQPGSFIGSYRIESLLGVGGMGEVYRARDTKLNRDVAIKILPPALATDPDRLARFKREAQVLASLNHPNIASIHGFEDSSGIHALVLELVDGPTLADRIGRGALPIDEALKIAKQIAEALEAAHEQGIIHRDLKPANIKVRDDGTVKVLDFGLAKFTEPTAAGAVPTTLTQSPTITSPAMTHVGMILGTAAYMSPEQAKGRTVDKRSDAWAFGAVLYEMLTGRRAFAGEDVTDTIVAVLSKEPDWTALPAPTPPSVRRMLTRCLKKDVRGRLRDIGDARIDIDDASAERATNSNAVVSLGHRIQSITAVAWFLSLIVAVTTTVFVLRSVSPQSAAAGQSVRRFELNLPPGVEIYTGSAQSAALSPDGTRLAFIGVVGAVRQIYVRRLDQFEAAPLRGTVNATFCFFSPDGRSLGFLAIGTGLKKISLGDELVVPLTADVNTSQGAAWGPDDRITFSRAGELWQVAASGGVASQVTRLDEKKGELSHAWPAAVAAGKVILFSVTTGSSRGAAHIEALTVATGRRQVLIDPGTRPLFAPTGHLIFFRNDVALAAAFNVERLAVTGPFTRVVETLAVDNTGVPVATVSDAGALVYPASGQATSQLIWISRQGLEQSITEMPMRYTNPRLSPDGRQVLVTASGDLWIQDTTRPARQRLTADETGGNSFAVWTANGTGAVFRTQTGLKLIATDGSGRLQSIPGTSVSDYPTSVSPDGNLLAITRLNGATSADVFVLSLTGDSQPRAIVQTSAYEGGAQFSPDGHWLAFVSGESDQGQVFVRRYPGPDRKWLVSTQGGTHPRWNRNGKELFYRDGSKMMAVDLNFSPDPVPSSPRLLFDRRYAFGISLTTPNYDVSPDGQRFVMVKDESESGRLSFVLNWFEELKARVPTK
jgi:serine/threonine protein kinase/Tol biopolymer transport system component